MTKQKKSVVAPAPSPEATKPGGKLKAVFAPPADPLSADALAVLVTRPSANAAVVVKHFANHFGEQDAGSLAVQIGTAISEIHGGDLKRLESMLYAQAAALQSVFVNMALRSFEQTHMEFREPYMRMALKAQNQARMTIETLATIKQGPSIFAKQANVAHNQQINHGVAVPAHAANSTPVPNKLLEVTNGQRLDPGATEAASGADSKLATLESVDRPEDGGRKAGGLQERVSRRAKASSSTADRPIQRDPATAKDRD